ncbi:putative bifunctional diguanylate cyclase/phosphodiesterase [Shewanella algidipiscicola]|uniref:Bifunctional diguanylate cyclase/phosphodiesterase n=1 Tax=Shewanella algidipiscicola TaxID=614070 RepID=A0ABQ4NSX0_9GAMM|nr:GGDEF domain-containing phosphodiesterase [Shewanella algidipiscicola]GIU02365.1 bifunctional diguanylate cyclase/phosphodiesterase [Shewanella algidipiscicola]
MIKRKYQYLLESIVNSLEKQQGLFNETAVLATRLLSEHLFVDYVGVCLFSVEHDSTYLVGHCDKLAAIDPVRPNPSLCPHYLSELKQHRTIDAVVAYNDARVQELHECYLRPKGIASTLEVAIRINGHLEGVLFLEHIEAHTWSESELHIAAQVADQLALTLATARAYETDERLSLFLKAIEHSEQVSMVVNLQTDIIEYVNGAHHAMSGIPKQKVIGADVNHLDFFKQSPSEARTVLAEVKRGKKVKGEVQIARLDGTCYWLRYSVKPFTTKRGNDYALVTAEDCSEARQHQTELERLAWRCPLTGLYNRRHFSQQLDNVTQGHLILLDLKGFKRFNDTYGHAKGDLLLIEMARRLSHFASMSKTQLLARVGSDEFALVIDTLDSQYRMNLLINRLYQHLCLPVMIKHELFEVKPALSVVCIETLEQMFAPLTCADIALQYAKNKQGDAIQVFNHALLSAFKETAVIERELQLALKSREFELYYQPLKDLKSNRYIGAEALIRWNHPKRGVLYPGAFIDVAEKSGMINSIGEWVLEAACRQLNLWQRDNINISMHVNVAAQQFFSSNLYDQIWQLVTRYRIKPNTLILEITETELMEDIVYVTHLCKELAELGVGLAIDDFGTGYSSMRYLKQFPISKLKIDRSFISDIGVSHESREIVSAIVAMAYALNISLTAEGVETLEQEDFLSELCCHQAQGFLYSPALREAEFSQFLRTSIGVLSGADPSKAH